MSLTVEQELALREKYEKLREEGSALEQLRAYIFSHGGVNGIRTIAYTFRRLDQNGDGRLDFLEFCDGLQAEGLDVSPELAKLCFDEIDKSGTGSISFDDFLIAVRPGLSPTREEIINRAFAQLDTSGTGRITINELKAVYSAQYHPKFISGEWTEEQVFEHWIGSMGQIQGDAITREDFYNYYVGVSSSIDDDVYFVDMMKRAWRLDEYARHGAYRSEYGEV